MAQNRRWPTRLVLVRHAESVGNLARDVAEANGEALIDIATRDMDVPLSPQGEHQAAELGEWLAETTTPARRVLIAVRPGCGDRSASRPPRRVHRLGGARRATAGAGIRRARPPHACGIEARFPEEAAARAHASASSTTGLPAARAGATWRCGCAACSTRWGGSTPARSVLVVAHEVVVYVFRYVLERLSRGRAAGARPRERARELLGDRLRARHHEQGSDTLELVAFDCGPENVPETVEPDVPRAPR